jgi:purine nucleosidase
MISSRKHIKQIIVDCDNTLGVENCDIDDALALLYLIGNPDYAHIDALCTTYGNSNIDAVEGATAAFINTLKLDIPLYRGAAGPQDTSSLAGEFLAKKAWENPDDISLLAIGSTTNLKLAERSIPGALSRLRDAAFMGGIAQDLIMSGIVVDELNFSCDPEATRVALENIPQVSIATGNNCFPAFFSSDDFMARILASRTATGTFIANNSREWCAHNREHFGTQGFICWDVVAAAHLIHPEFFINEFSVLNLSACALERGYIAVEPLAEEASTLDNRGPIICLPRIADPEAFVEHCFRSWECACTIIDTQTK